MMPTYIVYLIVALGLPLSCATQAAAPDQGEPYRDPARWQGDIDRFQAQDAHSPPPTGAVVCVGSSSIRMWHGRIAEDLAPLTVVPRGFGGSNMNDLLHYVDELVIAYQPRAVLIYEGDNDINQGVSPELVTQTFEALVQAIHDEMPGCRVYLLAIKPSPARWELWPVMQRANQMLADICDQGDLLTYIDVASPLLGADGVPRPELFVEDRLHLNQTGYDAWRQAIRPVLVGTERQFEPAGSD